MPPPVHLKPPGQVDEELWNHGRNIETEETMSRERDFYIWAFCAPISIASSRYILYNLNFHYPLHLLLLQLFGAGVYSWTRKPRNQNSTQNDASWIAAFSRESLASLSLVLGSQAILHLPNVVTLAMLAVVAHLSTLAGILIVMPGTKSTRGILGMLALAVSCAAILYGEYRLEVNGLLFSIPAALSAGCAKSLHLSKQSHVHSRTMFCVSTIVMAVAGSIFFGERTTSALHDVRIRWLPVLTINMITSGVVIALGKSWLVRIEDQLELLNPSPVVSNQLAGKEILATLWLVLLPGFISNITVHRSYTSLFQLLSFLATISILDNGRLFKVRKPSSGTWTRVEEEDVEDGLENSQEKEQYNTSKERSNEQTLFGLFILIACIAFTWANFRSQFSPSPSRHTNLSLDTEYRPSKRIEIVISACQEPIMSIKHIIESLSEIPSIGYNRTVHIYTKDPKADKRFLYQIGATNVTTLPNVGREGETYLHHVLDNWDNLAEHTIFVQGDVHNPREFYPRIRDYFDPEKTGMLSLGFPGNICDCETCGDRWGWSDPENIQMYHKLIYGSERKCSKVHLSYKGQFIASARRIRGLRKKVYEDIRNATINEKSWAHDPAYLKGRKDSMNNPQFGYTIERMWNMLMQCNDLDVGWKCPSLLSGTRSGGDQGDCQCFDPVNGRVI